MRTGVPAGDSCVWPGEIPLHADERAAHENKKGRKGAVGGGLPAFQVGVTVRRVLTESRYRER